MTSKLETASRIIKAYDLGHITLQEAAYELQREVWKINEGVIS